MGILSDRQIARDVKIEPAAEGIKRDGIISYGYSSYGYDARAGYKWRVFSPIMCREIDAKNFDPNALVHIDLSPVKHDWEKKEGTGTMRQRGVYLCKTCGLGNISPVDELCRDQPVNYILIPPHSFVLGETIEKFTIPRDVLCIVLGKSTYARCGLVVNVTPGEPEWEGHWTVEISNTTPLPARVYCGEGIMQCIFLRSDGDTENIRYILRHLLEDKDENPSHIIGPIAIKDSLNRLNTIEKPDDKNGTCNVSYKDKAGKYNQQLGLTLPKVDRKEQ